MRKHTHSQDLLGNTTLTEGISFTHDFFFIAGEACNEIIQPMKEASDDLSMTNLVVGNTYSYCIRAVNPIHYMDHPLDIDDEGRVLSSSGKSCIEHTIKWESSIHGKITTEPNAGKLPIEGVTTAYSLMKNENRTLPLECDGCSGIVKTKKGGTFEIVFNVDHPAMKDKNLDEFPVKLEFEKRTQHDNVSLYLPYL